MARNLHKNGTIITEIRCPVCKNIWYRTSRRKCPTCNESSGERTVRLCLDVMLVPYVREVYSGLGLTRYDFLIRDYKGKYCIIEFDGKQHFEHVKYFHRSKKAYNKYVTTTNIKLNYALNLGYRVLRISYKSEKYAGYWIWVLLNTDDMLILSDNLYLR